MKIGCIVALLIWISFIPGVTSCSKSNNPEAKVSTKQKAENTNTPTTEIIESPAKGISKELDNNFAPSKEMIKSPSLLKFEEKAKKLHVMLDNIILDLQNESAKKDIASYQAKLTDIRMILQT